jgi:hypothetical protein
MRRETHDLVQLVLVGSSLLCDLDGAVGSHIAAEKADVLEELADLRVGEEQLAQNLEVLGGLLALLGDVVAGRGGVDDVLGVELAGIGLAGG